MIKRCSTLLSWNMLSSSTDVPHVTNIVIMTNAHNMWVNTSWYPKQSHPINVRVWLFEPKLPSSTLPMSLVLWGTSCYCRMSFGKKNPWNIRMSHWLVTSLRLDRAASPRSCVSPNHWRSLPCATWPWWVAHQWLQHHCDCIMNLFTNMETNIINHGSWWTW